MIIARGRKDGAPSVVRSDTFVGEVHSDPVAGDKAEGFAINNIAFPPGAHTHWHWHEQGQILEVLAGEGWVCAEGEEPQLIRTGDTVWTPPGQRHWHGATSDSYLVHTATSLGMTNWLDPVQDYPASPRA